MENTNVKTLADETPIAKKKWETPQFFIISTNEVQSGTRNSYHERSIAKVPSAYIPKSYISGGQTKYNLYIS